MSFVSRRTPRPISTWVGSALILLFAFWLRIANLYALPGFIDESLHILWAQRWATGNTEYPWMMDGRMLTMILFSLTQLVGEHTLWLTRALVAILSVLTCAACIAIGFRLGSRKAGLLAGLIYAVLPITLFHERQALTDPVAGSFAALAMVISLQMLSDTRWRLPLLLGFLLATAFLSKAQGAIVLIYLALNVFLAVVRPLHPRRRVLSRYGVALLVAGACIYAFIFVFSARMGRTSSPSIQQTTVLGSLAQLFSDYTHLASSLGFTWQETVKIFSAQIGWFSVGLAGLALLLVPSRNRFHVANLLIFGVAIVVINIVAELTGISLCCAGRMPARYIMFMAVPLAVLAGLGCVYLARWVGTRLRGQPTGSLQQGLALCLALCIFAPVSANDAALLTIPERAAYSPLDFWGYFTGYYPGRPIMQAAQEIKGLEANSTLPPVIISDVAVSLFGVYFDRGLVDVRAGGEVFPVEFGTWFSRGQHIYIVDDLKNAADISETDCHLDYGAWCREIGRFRVPSDDDRVIRVRLATSADAELRTIIYPEFFPRPEKLTENYNALAASLNTQTSPLALLVYPPNQSEQLKLVFGNSPTITIVPIGDSWPLDIVAAQAQLQTITASQINVQAAFVEETKGDPNRQLETWLKTHLFILNEQWFGPVRLLNFVGDGPVEQTIPVEGRFGESLKLDSIEVLDSSPQSGGRVRLRLNWQTASPITTQYKIFAHIFSGDRIIAQHDGQPVGELRPTNSWQVDELIRDQFAIQIPADAPPGSYQLRIGLYDLETQERLPVLFPDGTSGEFFEGGSITIQ